MLGTLINIIGLILDFVGVVGLYNAKFKGLDKIEVDAIKVVVGGGLVGNDAKGASLAAVSVVEETMNQAIENMNKRNELGHKKALKWFICVLIGFLFQLTGAIISICSSK